MGSSSLELKLTLILILFMLLLGSDSVANGHAIAQRGLGVKISTWEGHVQLDNGIVKLTLLNPSGHIASIEHCGINVLEHQFLENRRGYWDIVGDSPEAGKGIFDRLEATTFSIITNKEDIVEISFSRSWNPLIKQQLPLNIDKRFVMIQGESGFYSYAIFEHREGWPALHIGEGRIAFKLDQELFSYMAVSDEMQRIMPTWSDLLSGERLGYKEATRLINPKNPELRGEVDDKYMYANGNKDTHVHGWISIHRNVGFWVITPSDEFRAGGPFKPDISSHAAGTSLAMFFSGHYAGRDFGVNLGDGEPWKKVFGPVFIYLNSGKPPRDLWRNAKRQMYVETEKWPYEFPASIDFPHSHERGTVTGQFSISDWFLNMKNTPAKSANIGLASPGAAGSWQTECKGYQFWTKTDEQGKFTISDIRPGIYNLYAWVPGFPGDYMYQYQIVIRPGDRQELGTLVYYPPRTGPTLWEIGYPDRSASEFFVPDPYPNLENKLFLNSIRNKYRQYGLWDRYTDYFPTQDLIYTVGKSDYHKDWWYAHLNRKVGNGYIPATWQIRFNLQGVNIFSTYTLRVAIAASGSSGVLHIWVNNPVEMFPFTTGRTGMDNAIARHGIHGQYKLYSVVIKAALLRNGENTIYIKQAEAGNPFTGVLYDYLRLEGPAR